MYVYVTCEKVTRPSRGAAGFWLSPSPQNKQESYTDFSLLSVTTTYLTKKQVIALEFSIATAIQVKILRRRPAAGAKLPFSVVASAAREEKIEQKGPL